MTEPKRDPSLSSPVFGIDNLRKAAHAERSYAEQADPIREEVAVKLDPLFSTEGLRLEKSSDEYRAYHLDPRIDRKSCGVSPRDFNSSAEIKSILTRVAEESESLAKRIFDLEQRLNGVLKPPPGPVQLDGQSSNLKACVASPMAKEIATIADRLIGLNDHLEHIDRDLAL